MVSLATLQEAVSTYNAYRSPMATAEVDDYAGTTFAVRFEGPFCRMCCDYDYFEDLVYELDALGEDAASIDVTDVAYEGDETFVVGYAAGPRARHRSGQNPR